MSLKNDKYKTYKQIKNIYTKSMIVYQYYMMPSFQTDADKENIGDVEFYPNTGFPYAYYPYTGQEGYRAPLVMAYFPNIKMGMVVMVRCKAWAANIQHSIHDWDYRGSTRFEVLVD